MLLTDLMIAQLNAERVVFQNTVSKTYGDVCMSVYNKCIFMQALLCKLNLLQ